MAGDFYLRQSVTIPVECRDRVECLLKRGIQVKKPNKDGKVAPPNRVYKHSPEIGELRQSVEIPN